MRNDHAVGLFGTLVKREALDRGHGPGLALGGVDRLLNLLLHRRHILGRADDLHAAGRVIHEAVERHDGKHRLDRLGGRRVVDSQQLAEPGLPGHGVGWEVGVDDD